VLTDELLGKLAQDITTEERWHEVHNAIRRTGSELGGRASHPTMGVTADEWFFYREQARMEFGVYRTTSVLEELNRAFPGHYIHVKQGHEDLQMVAYTSSIEDAKRDKKHVIRLGRLMQKLSLLFTADFINGQCAMHAAEADPHVEIGYGYEALKEAYIEGPGACMSKGTSSYDTMDKDGNKHYPWEVYDAPGIGVAVLRDHEKRIIARSLVLPEKKIFIRATYGSPVLQRKLEANGYKPGAFHGTKFKTIVLETGGYVKVVCPYIDGMNRAGGTNVSLVALIDDNLTSIDHVKAEKISRAFPGASATYVCATSTSGYAQLTPIRSEDIAFKDGITGLPLDDDAETIKVFYKGNVVNTLRSSWYMHTSGPYVTAHTYLVGNSRSSVEAREEECIVRRGVWYTIDAKTLSNLNLAMLDPAFYGQRQYAALGDCVESGNDLYIRASDARVVIRAVNGDNVKTYEHNSLNTKDRKLTKVHRLHGSPDVYAAEGVEIVKTVTGRKVVKGVHNVVELYNGEYALQGKDTDNTIIFGEIYWFIKHMPEELKFGGAIWMREARKYITQRLNDASVDPLQAFTTVVDALATVTIGSTYISTWGYPFKSERMRIAADLGLTAANALSDMVGKELASRIMAAVEGEVPLNYTANTVEEGRKYTRELVREAYGMYLDRLYADSSARAVDYNAPKDTRLTASQIVVIDVIDAPEQNQLEEVLG
jgi:hypothetical protein